MVAQDGKESAYSAGEPGSIPGEGNGNSLQYSCLKNPMDREAWQAMVHRITKVRHNLAHIHVRVGVS